jgi:hypothetical protein
MSRNFVQWGGEEFLVIYGGQFLEVLKYKYLHIEYINNPKL